MTSFSVRHSNRNHVRDAADASSGNDGCVNDDNVNDDCSYFANTNIITPVVRSFPISTPICENSNIPFSMTVTPLLSLPPTPTSSARLISDADDAHQKRNHINDFLSPALSLLTTIPKCYHCGAPHASFMTYERLHPAHTNHANTNRNQHANCHLYYCRLCHKTFQHQPSNDIPQRHHRDHGIDTDRRRALLHRHPTAKVRNTANNSSTSHDDLNIVNNKNENDDDVDHHHSEPPVPTTTGKPMMEVTHVFDLPLRLPLQSSSSTSTPLYRMPAMSCPVLWYICLDGGTRACATPQYWQQVSATLQSCLDTAPPHVHVALLIASQRDDDIVADTGKSKSNHDANVAAVTTASVGLEPPKQLSLYDLHQSAGSPKINTYWSDELIFTEMEMIQTILYQHAPVPVSHTIRAAIRSLVDYPNTTTSNGTTHDGGTTGSKVEHRCPIGWVTEVLLTSFQHGAIHVGHRNTTMKNNHGSGPRMGGGGATSAATIASTNSANAIMTNTGSAHAPPTKLLYAGVKLTFLLCDRPTGIGHNNSPTSPPPTTTPPIGERYSYHPSSTNTPNAELTPSQLQQHYYHPSFHRPNHHINLHSMVEYYAELGRECSDMAMGVDLILLHDSSIARHSPNDFALPLYQPLSERSGAPGPVLLDLASTMTASTNAFHPTDIHHISTTRLHNEVLSRTPWQTGRAFGAELRVRLSSGYMVDPNTVTVFPNVTGPQLAPIYNEAGGMGPVCSVPESSQLWRMGTTDPYTSCTFDLMMIPHMIIRDHVTIDDGLVVLVRDDDAGGIEDSSTINLYPIIQICCAFTTIVTEVDNESGIVSYHTIRQMRVTNRIVPLAYTVEALYASIDTEALAVVLFHRIALANFQDGMISAATMTQQWLQCLLLCIYKSAMEQFQIEEQTRELGYESSNSYNPYDKSHRYFYPGERLLFLEGELSAEDVLLAQGHERLRPIVLMVYLLLQCDAFRCSSDYYRPSYDVRSASISQMSCMSPTCLTRCIAPRIQLWESGLDVAEPLYDVLDLRSDVIQEAILECTTTSTNAKGGRSSQGLILFLDTPEQIVVMDARYVNNTNFGNHNRDHSSDNRRQQPAQSQSKRRTAHDDDPLVVGVGLQNAISDAASSYRVRPTIIYELHQSDTLGERTLLRLVDHLIEDTYLIASQSENFNDWKAQMARDVQM